MESPDPRSITVRIPAGLQARVGNQRSLTVGGRTVREIIDALERDHPGLRFNLCYETGELRPFVNVFLDTENVRYLRGLETPVPPGATIWIIHSVAGGCGDAPGGIQQSPVQRSGK